MVLLVSIIRRENNSAIKVVQLDHPDNSQVKRIKEYTTYEWKDAARQTFRLPDNIQTLDVLQKLLYRQVIRPIGHILTITYVMLSNVTKRKKKSPLTIERLRCIFSVHSAIVSSLIQLPLTYQKVSSSNISVIHAEQHW